VDLHVLLGVETIIIVSVKFDLQMSRGGIATFALVINYLDKGWNPRHITIRLFEMHETTSSSMAL
jgi:hypothetical protein